MIVLFNKPYKVLCQFTDNSGRINLSNFIKIKGVYAAGRLDYDSEGLIVLTDDGRLQNIISDPEHNLLKVYWVQVEGKPREKDLDRLRQGILLKDGITKPALARVMEEPEIWERVPPIRFRENIPTSWIQLSITEGKNRQVRRMTAAIGFPTLRLIRYAIGSWDIAGISNGNFKVIT